MRKTLLFTLALMLVSTLAFAQMTGSVSGTVVDSLNAPVGGAMVNLMADGHHGGGGHGGGHGSNYMAQTADDGTFQIQNVGAGNYVAMAAKMGVGHDAEDIVVTSGQNTVVNFVLTMGGGGGHDGGNCDSLEIVELSGWAIVVVDSLRTHYFLDTNADDTADFRLMFGPDWYNPDSGAQRPANGDSIWITGGLMGYSEPQPVVVYEINGLFWRTPGDGHGGDGGHGGGGDYGDPDSLTLIETSGLAIVVDNDMMTRYFLDTNSDDTAEYNLNFGAPWYDPGNGATRPLDGDNVSIVGGLMEGRMGHLDMIIVYEINGQYWRDPGDTLALWYDPLSVDDPSEKLPNSYLIASSYPNPFNPTATISFELTQAQNVKVTVYDLLGREVAVLADNAFPAGSNQVTFNAGQDGSSLYFYRIVAGSQVATGKMIFLK